MVQGVLKHNDLLGRNPARLLGIYSWRISGLEEVAKLSRAGNSWAFAAA